MTNDPINILYILILQEKLFYFLISLGNTYFIPNQIRYIIDFGTEISQLAAIPIFFFQTKCNCSSRHQINVIECVYLMYAHNVSVNSAMPIIKLQKLANV